MSLPTLMTLAIRSKTIWFLFTFMVIVTISFLQDKFRRMLQLQSRLGDYFELIRPGRDLIKEGELQKVSRKGVGPRYFILLSDCLLYTSYSGSWSGSDTTSLRVSYQIPLSTLSVRLPNANNNFR